VSSNSVVTYTLLCGYIPFRATETQKLIEECKAGKLELCVVARPCLPFSPFTKADDSSASSIGAQPRKVLEQGVGRRQGVHLCPDPAQPGRPPDCRAGAQAQVARRCGKETARARLERGIQGELVRALYESVLRLRAAPALAAGSSVRSPCRAAPRRTPSRRWKSTINTLIATRRFAQTAEKARGTSGSTPSSSDSSPQETPNGGEGAPPRTSASTDEYNTAEEDDPGLHDAIRRRDRDHETVRERELQAKSHERQRDEGREGRKSAERERDLDRISAGLDGLQT